MTQATKTRKQTEINAASIARVSSKSGNFLGYLVKSDSQDEYYQVTWDEKAHGWQCTCKSVKPCKHCRAIAEVQVVRFAKPVSQVEALVCSELKTVFSSLEEEYEYRLHAYGKRSAIGWMYEQKYAQAQAAQAEEDARFKAEKDARDAEAYEKRVAFLALQKQVDEIAAQSEQEAEAKLAAFKAGKELSQGEIEAARSYMVHLYDAY